MRQTHASRSKIFVSYPTVHIQGEQPQLFIESQLTVDPRMALSRIQPDFETKALAERGIGILPPSYFRCL